ncbi:MFS transporter [Streptomyces oceani]|uniref:MFS transporter n=1 Tax=Streptomyces oceani TaxID=1075402 RepID=UPI001FCDEA33|nr:MFS transporter [Streptomyces oceani]
MTTIRPPRLPATDEETAGSDTGSSGTAAGRDRAGVDRAGSGRFASGTLASLLARVPGRGRWWFPIAAAMLFGSVLHLVWLWLIASGGGDLAAQDAWAEFVGQHPDSAYNLAWYGGMHPVSYSVISPYLMAVVGVRPVLILSGVLSAGVLALILVRSSGVRRPLVPALAGAFSFVCNAASGRVTFALGTLFALLAIAAIWSWPGRWRHARKTRGAVVALFSALSTAGSPVAALFLLVVAGALVLERRWRIALALALPPPVMVGLSALFFPFSGTQPMPWHSVVFPLASALLVRFLVPSDWRVVRRSAEVYALGVVLTWAIPSQVGSNVERLGLHFGTVVLATLIPLTMRRTRRRAALVIALVIVGGWQLVKPTYDVIATTPEASWAHELAPLVHQLKKVDADRGRVEVVPVQSHRESSAFTQYVNLARGWSRQADTGRNPMFYDEDGFSPERYHDWLKRWAVRYVVLSSDEPDVAAKQEAKLVRSGPDFLEKVWQDDNWKLYRVREPEPLASPPAEDSTASAGSVTVKVREAGEVLVRIPWSPWLGLVTEEGKRIEEPAEEGANRNGCLRPAEPMPSDPTAPPPGEEDAEEEAKERPTDEWTVLEAPRAGTYRIAAPYRLPRGTACPDSSDGGS